MSGGVIITPSENVPLRDDDITGYILKSYNSFGKVIWAKQDSSDLVTTVKNRTAQTYAVFEGGSATGSSSLIAIKDNLDYG